MGWPSAGFASRLDDEKSVRLANGTCRLVLSDEILPTLRSFTLLAATAD